jgi:acyl dehydratase
MSDDLRHPLDDLEDSSHYFEDLEMGQKFPIPSRTMTDALFAAFQLASGDNHPIHYDVEYCRRHGHPNMLAHGFQALIQTAPGAGDFPTYVGSALVGFIEQSSKFLKPVYAGDTLYPMLEVAELTPQRTTGVVVLKSSLRNQRGETVLEGMMKFLIRRRTATV